MVNKGEQMQMKAGQMRQQGKKTAHVTIEWGVLSPTIETLGFRTTKRPTPHRASQPDAYATLCMILRENGTSGYLSAKAQRFW